MINLAAEYVQTGKYHHNYKYIIVDEYQDISKSRYILLKSMRDTKDFKLFCVGDDWQSIYRFAGSDIGYILNFEKYWGISEINKIETTYRFTRSLIEISGYFIMKSPAQIKKAIRTESQETEFALGEINGYTDKNAIDFMTEKLNDLPENRSIFFLGRYSFDVKMLDSDFLFEYKYNNVTGFTDVKYSKRQDLIITFITVHKSKGLQADYVFILNNKRNNMGFPSNIQDSSILLLLLDNCDSFPYAEERR
jgi:DNA helicase-4